MNLVWEIFIFIWGILSLIVGYEIKEKKWLGFHFGIRQVKVDVRKYTRFIYKIDYCYGLLYIAFLIFCIISKVVYKEVLLVLIISNAIICMCSEMKFRIKSSIIEHK